MRHFPVEIIEEILSCQELSVEDVLNFSLTCSYFRDIVVNSSIIWKAKFTQTWPQFLELMDGNFKDWFPEIKYIYELRHKTRSILSTMSPRFYKRYELSDSHLLEWSDLCKEHPRTGDYLIFDLMKIVNTNIPIESFDVVPITTPGNLTMQYYATKVLRYLRQRKISKEWFEYLSFPPDKQILEKGAVFVAQWCQPQIEVRWKDIAQQLDELAVKVKEYLKTTHPDHPLFDASPEQLRSWRSENLRQNQWNAKQCRQIIGALGVVLYQHLGFSGNNHAYYLPGNSFINEVLNMRTGLPITLAVLYESVARRLGLKCDPISFPAHFLLRFTEGNEKDGKPTDSYYIDVFNGGDIIRRGACPHSQSARQNREYPSATAQQVVERMANNLEVSGRNHTHPNGRITRLRSSLELLQLVSPTDITACVSLAKLYMLHNMDTKPLISRLLIQDFEVSEQVQRIVQMLQDYEAQQKWHNEVLFKKVEPAQRSSILKFAVGMVMRHLTQNYKCVIYDWDPVCLASAEWQMQMHVHTLSRKDEQPFYNVLVEDGSHRYVAQENLAVDCGELYGIEDIGRNFSHFYQTHYIPNAEKEKEYPADREMRNMYHQKIVCEET